MPQMQAIATTRHWSAVVNLTSFRKQYERELGHDQIDIPKIDFEGAEYDVIDDISQSEIRPRQILIEFHHRFPGVRIKKTKTAIDTIKSMGYGLFSISATNEEFCFIRKSDCRAA